MASDAEKMRTAADVRREAQLRRMNEAMSVSAMKRADAAKRKAAAEQAKLARQIATSATTAEKQAVLADNQTPMDGAPSRDMARARWNKDWLTLRKRK